MGQQHKNDQQRAHADAHAGGEDAETAAGVFSGGGTQLIEGENEIENDAEEVECVDDGAGDVAGAGEKRPVASAVVFHVDGGIEKKDGDAIEREEKPFDPSGAGIDARAFGKVNAEEEQGGRASQLQRLIPEAAQGQR